MSAVADGAGATGAGKARVGFFSFTEVTDPALHRQYNRWHQLDHLPEQMPLPGIVFGQRWVSTPVCRRARLVDGGRLDPIDYVTLYLMTDPVPEVLDRFAALASELAAEGRFFSARRSHLSGPFEVESACAAPGVLVSGAAVPYRPGTGVYVVVTEEPDAVGGPSREAADLSPLLEVAGVAGAWAFRSAGRLAGERWRPGRHRVVVSFLDGDVLETAARLAAVVPALAGADTSAVVFAGPFETIAAGRWDWFEPESARPGAGRSGDSSSGPHPL